MAWDHLSIDKPHLAYIIIGGFTSLFMLCSSFVKERLYIGEATVATACGIIFGPYAANLFDPISWGNVDKITLETSRIVLVVQCFAIGVELPKSYMERHWRSVTFLLIPVMTFGWLITSLFVWWMVEPLTWLESLAVAACVTATDPVLASSVVGKGKFAKRVPKHLRDILSAESGCNDGMAFPFIYLAVYLIQEHLNARETMYHWFCFTILYECIFGAIYGFAVGYIARQAIRLAHERDLIDRESFLVFYFVLALFCAGTGALLGLDDLLVGFAAGVGFSNDGWFQEKTEESHVSNVIDLLLNLAYFVYFGAIIPWDQFNAPELGLIPWKLVVIAIFVLLFRRLPIMLALKPIIPDVKNWREALFAGHFGPIGVGAIFAAMLTRAELETESTQPLAVLPAPGEENYLVVAIIWPVVTFLVLISIIVHGSSIAVFTLGKRINTLTLTMSYTTANDQTWLNRLPRIASVSRTSMSKSKADYDPSDDSDEKVQFPAGSLPPVGWRGNFLRRQKDEDVSKSASRSSSRHSTSRKKMGAGGPISHSAIKPKRPEENESPEYDEKMAYEPTETGEGTPVREDEEQKTQGHRRPKNERGESSQSSAEVEAYDEGGNMVVEDEEGNVLRQYSTKGETEEEKAAQIEHERKKLDHEVSGEHAKNRHHPHERNTEGSEIEEDIVETAAHPEEAMKKIRHQFGHWSGWKERFSRPRQERPESERLRGPAHAYQYGNTIIVEDEDGEVVRKYELPSKKASRDESGTSGPPERPGMQAMRRMTTWTGFNKGKEVDNGKQPEGEGEDELDSRIRFTVGGSSRRMSKQDFIKQIQGLDPKARVEAINESNAPVEVKRDVRKKSVAPIDDPGLSPPERAAGSSSRSPEKSTTQRADPRPGQQRTQTQPSPTNTSTLQPIESHRSQEEDDLPPAPSHAVSSTVSRYTANQPESAASRRRRLAAAPQSRSPAASVSPHTRPPTNTSTRHGRAPLSSAADPDDSDDDGTERVPPGKPVQESTPGTETKGKAAATSAPGEKEDGETAAEKKRRLAALGEAEVESDSDEDGGERELRGRRPVEEPGETQDDKGQRPGIRFAPDVNDAKGGGLATYRSMERRR